MIDPKEVSAVIVTRGDVDLGSCLAPILNAGIEEIVIRKGNAGVWERYEAAISSSHRWIYTQDDDCAVDVMAVLEKYDLNSDQVVCNMPEDRRSDYRDGIALVGWGSVFNISNVRRAFPRAYSPDSLMRREADRYFTAMNDVKLIDVPFNHLPWAFDKDRMGCESRHGDDLRAIRERIAAVGRKRIA